MIHKATIGTTRLDPGYTRRKEEALRRGYLWGSYHWGVAGDPAKQADFYIDTVKPQADELMALDLEDAQSTTLMNGDEAIVFINRVKERTGRYQVLYTNHSSAKLISARYKDSVFVHTPLWYACFKAKVSDFPTGVWPSYTLWQFSSEIKPQLPAPGTKLGFAEGHRRQCLHTQRALPRYASRQSSAAVWSDQAVRKELRQLPGIPARWRGLLAADRRFARPDPVGGRSVPALI